MLMTESEVAEYLRLSVETLRKARYRDKPLVPYMMFGSSIRYDFEDVQRYMQLIKDRGGD